MRDRSCFLLYSNDANATTMMSRVVAMLLRNIEMGTVSSKPGYLTDWNFNYLTSFRSGERQYK
ncbi:hypothetical protein Pint_18015 [Pistacia integerrima]|uniref:Uncharacterized protein n=1 Tax=Pistacia integerrima TaxID=434235 RepID=A0ACC0YU46_9ROSI|nr:hypothetical protein Pint_18015 [Pistacia integerrima]